jgi:hypothetical protein
MLYSGAPAANFHLALIRLWTAAERLGIEP